MRNQREKLNVQKMVGLNIVAWTGGSRPRPLSDISTGEANLVKILFLNQCLDFEMYWGDFPNKDTRKIFWGRARGDAHATFRERG